MPDYVFARFQLCDESLYQVVSSRLAEFAKRDIVVAICFFVVPL